MESNGNKTAKWKQIAIVGFVIVAFALVVLRFATKDAALAEDTQTTFSSPAAAGVALAEAADRGDENALAKILGGETKVLLSAEDKNEDTAALKAFAAKYDKMNRWVDMTDGSRTLYVGADNYAFPVPLAKDASGQWHFDAVAGAEEIRARNIGRNELLTMDACSALTLAQQAYFANTGDSGEFAQRIISSPGKQDGLYWPSTDNEASSPLASLSEFPKSSLASLSGSESLGIDGYTLRILKAQGDDAPGGAKDYVVDGKMTGGFAIIATPVKYAETGIMTFMTGSDGMVYERDLGPDTKEIASSIQAFNPTDDWAEVE